ncbi:MAG: hypothetical protein COX82_02390 [Candidatus Magasanikbacteria bacterium CG_4_10_14_0_2_um_filter_41_10]|uniref:Uncharacterized protein n=1 Tax=Candidatus Magasanikbacteria bacterium CG_4_10_14_0_2_um_filter_41_10 TaxID=1974638 RepID=A0A2M7V4S7_9BACT|nr:MAG: hypothetical protein COX82_02390 [Candidatus Magasanikbacteria bacterium CG_4_10_14_0_2_um_filter_41_10]
MSKNSRRLLAPPPSKVSPEQITEKLRALYDSYKEIQATGVMHENHPGGGYFPKYFNDVGRWVTGWESWREILGLAGDNLKQAIAVAQPFVQEDLSFLERLRDGDHVAKSRTLTEVWKPKEEGSYDAITEAQQNILRGKITKVLEK